MVSFYYPRFGTDKELNKPVFNNNEVAGLLLTDLQLHIWVSGDNSCH